MKKPVSPTLYLLICCAANLVAQKNFIPAQWTKPDGSQTDILIDYRAWETMPANIRYKPTEEAPEQDLSPAIVRTLQVQTRPEEIYVGREADVAVFSQSPSLSATIESRRKVIFLRALILGKLNLYKYQDEHGIMHYFIENDSIWEELIYHEYFVDSAQKQTRAHHKFRTQLLRATIDCAALAEKVKKISFGEKSLIGVVSDYNSSLCDGHLLFREEKARGKIQFGIRGGGAISFNKTGFEFASKYSGQNNYVQPKLGIGAIYFLPRRLQRNALLLDVLYDQQTYKTTEIVPTQITENFLQAHLALRRYYSSGALKPFVNGGVLLGLPVGETKLSGGWTLDYSPSAQAGISIGGGARWNRLEVETRLMANHLMGIKRGGVDTSLTWFFTMSYWIN